MIHILSIAPTKSDMKNISSILRILVLSSFVFFFQFSVKAQEDADLKKQVRLSLEELRAFVAIPNDANNPKDLDLNLVWLDKAFKSRGFETRLLETEGAPLFYAEMLEDPKKPTILFYMHFDGQSVDRSKWDQKDPYIVVLKELVDGQWVEKPWSGLKSSTFVTRRLVFPTVITEPASAPSLASRRVLAQASPGAGISVVSTAVDRSLSAVLSCPLRG